MPEGAVDGKYEVIEENAEYELILPKDEMDIGRAPMHKRFLAFIIDLIVVFIVFIIPFVTVFSVSSGIVSTDIFAIENFIYENYQILATMEISIDFIILFYFAFSEGVLGYTLGKKIMNLNVGQITYSQAFIRNFTKAFFFTLPFLSLADLVWLIFNKEGRRLTDVIARTKVLYEPSLEVEYKWQGGF